MKKQVKNTVISIVLCTIAMVLVLTSCKKDNSPSSSDTAKMMIVSGTVTGWLDVCSGNGLVISIESPQNIGTDEYESVYGSNAVIIPRPESIFVTGDVIDSTRVNYRMFNGQSVNLGIGDNVILECRPYEQNSSDYIYYHHTSLCNGLDGPPQMNFFVVTKVISVN